MLLCDAGKGLVVSSDGPGIFLQGLAVHGRDGRLLPGMPIHATCLPPCQCSLSLKIACAELCPTASLCVGAVRAHLGGKVFCSAGKDLPSKVVEEGFKYSTERKVPLAGFLGDTTVTLFMTDELEARPRFVSQLSHLSKSVKKE